MVNLREIKRTRLIKPWKMAGPGTTGRRTALFAKKILEKYGVLKDYLFDSATLVFLEQISGKEYQKKNLDSRIQYTVKLMLLHQTKNRLSKDLIMKKNTIHSNIQRCFEANMHHLLAADKRTYSELHQLHQNNQKINEFKTRMDRYEKSRKKMIYQMQNVDIISSRALKKSVYKLVGKYTHLNKVEDMYKIRNVLKKHDILHVIKNGSLSEKRAAYEVLKKAFTDLSQDNNNITNLFYKHRHHDIQNNFMENRNIIKNGQAYGFYREKESMYFIYQEKEQKLFQSVNQVQTQYESHEKDLVKVQNTLEHHKQETIREKEQVEQMRKQLFGQKKQMEILTTKQEELRNTIKKQEKLISGRTVNQLKGKLHLERIRYGLE